MGCIFEYKGKEFQSKKELIEYFDNHKITKVDFKKDVAFKSNHKFTTGQQKEITNALAYVIHNYAIGDLNTFSAVDFNDIIVEHLQRQISRVPKNSKKENAIIFRNRHEDVLAESEYFAEKVKDWFDDKGIRITEELVQDENGNLFTENVLLIDPKAKATEKLKALFNLIPARKRNNEGNVVADKSDFLNTAVFMKEDTVWNDLKVTLADIPNVTLEKMIKRLEEDVKHKPYYSSVISKLKEKQLNPITEELEYDEILRTQFFNAFAISRVDYMSLLLRQNDDGTYEATTTKQDPSSQENILLDNWANAFKYNHLVAVGTKGDSYFNKESLNNVKTEYAKIKKELAELIRKYKPKATVTAKRAPSLAEKEAVSEYYKKLIKFLENVGIGLTEEGVSKIVLSIREKNNLPTFAAIDKFLKDKDYGITFVMRDIERLATAKDSRATKITEETEQELNPIQNNRSALRKFTAKLQGEALQNLAETYALGAEGNRYSNYGPHSLISQTINELNDEGTKEGAITKITNDFWGNGSRTIKWIQKALGNKLKYYVINNYKLLDQGDEGAKPSKLNETDSLVIDINFTLHDNKTAHHTGIAEADKSRHIVFAGGDFVKSGLTKSKKGGFQIGENVVSIFLEYFIDEMARMRKIHSDLYGPKKLDESKLVANLHSKENVLKSYLFPELTKPAPKTKRTLLEAFGLVEEVDGIKIPVIPNKADLLNNRKLKEFIEKSVTKLISKDLVRLANYGVIENVKGEYKNVAIDSRILKNNYNNSVVKAVADYTINSIIGNIEMTKLFTGDPALYKQGKGGLFGDLKKRAPLIIGGGTVSRVYTDKNTGEEIVKPTYTSATTASIEIPSAYFTQKDKKGKIIPNKALVDRMYKALDGKMSKSDLTKAIDYSEVNIADASAWITLDLFRQRMNSWGKWTPAHERTYKDLKNGQLTPEGVKLFAQPIKTIHVERQSSEGHGVIHYHKQSEAVIIPGLFPELDALQEANPDVDHFVTLDGKKEGASGVTVINDGDKLVPTEMPYVTLHTKYAYLQQDLPTKLVNNQLVGSQIVKNLLGEIDLNAEYEVRGLGKVKGDVLKRLYHSVIHELSEIEVNDLKEEFGVDETGKVDDEKYNEFLAKSLKDDITAYEEELLSVGVGIDGLPHLREKLENKLMAAVLNTAVKLRQLGSANIQMTGFGTAGQTVSLKDVVNNGIIWFKDPSEGLKPMRLEEENEVLYTEKAQVLLPHSVVLNLLGPGYKDMTSEEISELIDPSILTGISYRIPNQAPSSNDSFEIVGILPEHMGDTIISYNEITKKTGSDFDIDKAFIILPNVEFDRKTNKIRRPKYAYEMEEEEAYEEKVKKDFLKSRRAKEIYKEIEDVAYSEDQSYKEVKENIISLIKEIKGNLNAEQDFLNKKETIDDASLVTIADIVQDTLRDITTNLKKFGKTSPRASRREKEFLKQELKENYKILNEIKEEMTKHVRDVLEYEGMMTLEEYKALDPASLKRHTKAALQNFRLDLMQSILENPKTYPAVVTTLDDPYLEKEAKKLFSTDINEDNDSLSFFRGSTQRLNKAMFDKAKGMVGTIANHSVDHNLSKGEELAYQGVSFGVGKKVKGESELSAKVDTNGIPTTRWLNLYMNAIVDAANDPYIAQANINQFTAPVAFMLIRSGVPLNWVNAFIGQAPIQSLVRGKNIAESKIATRKYDKKGKLVTPEKKLIDFYESKTGLDYKEISAKVLEDLGKKLPVKALKANINKIIKSQKEYKDEFIALAAFMELKERAKVLSKSNRAAKADVDIGKNLLEAYIKELNLIQLLQSGDILNLHTKFGIDPDPNVPEYDEEGFINITLPKLAGTFHKHGVQTALRIGGSKTITASPAMRQFVFNFLLDNNPEAVTNSKTLDSLIKEVYSFLTSLPGSNITNGNMDNLFLPKKEGEKTFARELYSFLKRNKNKPGIKDNAFLNELRFNFRDLKDNAEQIPEFIYANSKRQDRELMQQGWIEFAEVAPKMSEKLAKYVYHFSGFRPTIKAFYEWLPPNIYAEKGFHFFMDKLKIAASDPDFLTFAVEEIAQHLWSNKFILKTASKVDVMRPPLPGIKKTAKIKGVFMLRDANAFAIGKNEHGEVETVRYLKYGKLKNLYKLVGYTYVKDKDSGLETRHPVYKAISKKGYDSKSNVIKEYGALTKKKGKEAFVDKSIFTQNNVTLTEEVETGINAMELEPKLSVQEPLKDAVQQNINKSKTEASEEMIDEAIRYCKGK
jgi:hypothetical protein